MRGPAGLGTGVGKDLTNTEGLRLNEAIVGIRIVELMSEKT